MIKQIYEHLKTRKKYNNLQLKYDVKCDEFEEKILEYNTEKKIKLMQRNAYEKRISELLERNIDLTNDIAKLKKDIKELRKEIKKDGKVIKQSKGTK